MQLLDLPSELLTSVAEASADATSLCRLATTCKAFRQIEQRGRQALWKARALKDFPSYAAWFRSGVLGTLDVSWKTRYAACAREVFVAAVHATQPYLRKRPPAPTLFVDQLNAEYEFFLELHPQHVGHTFDMRADTETLAVKARLCSTSVMVPTFLPGGHRGEDQIRTAVSFEANFPEALDVDAAAWFWETGDAQMPLLMNGLRVDVYARNRQNELALMCTIVTTENQDTIETLHAFFECDAAGGGTVHLQRPGSQWFGKQ